MRGVMPIAPRNLSMGGKSMTEEKNDSNHINDLELVMLYNKHLQYLQTLELGEETLFGNIVNERMISTIKKRRDDIKARYVGPKYRKLASHLNKRLDESISRRISY